MQQESCKRHSWVYKIYDKSKYGHMSMRTCMNCGLMMKKYVKRVKKKPP